MSKPLIYGLLLSILMVITPHAGHLPLWVSALCAALLVWRTYLTYTGNPLPQRWLLLGITFASVGGILIAFHTLFGREAGVTLLILLTTLKFMELRSPRDATVLVYLACFIIITNFFYSQSIPTALYMLATLLAIVTAWVHLQAQTIALKPRLHIAATLLLQAIPLTLVLFILFPRVQGPLWGLPQDAFASSGLDDKMAPGSLSRLILSDEVAFRVSYAGKPPRREQMYWRGPVLWNFDGRTWTPGRTAFSIAPQFTETGQAIDYSVTLEPHNKTWLFALDMPEHLSIPANITDDFRIVQNEPVKARLRYEARSNLSYHANPHEAERQIQRALRLPPALNPQALQLAADWRAQAEAAPSPQPSGETTSHSTKPASGRGGNRSLAGIDESIVRAALAYFGQQNFQYTLEPPPLGFHAVDDFLFTTRQGFCEHYASAFVFLMRAAHIPARVVTGYQGGEFNALGNYYIVRQSDAHAWAEVWLAGQGWVRIDPTAVIAPARVERGLSAAVANNAALPFMARNPPQWLHELRLNWDTLANQWNQWVLGYNSERQFAFLTRLGMESVTWQKMALNMATGVGLLVALFALFMLRHLFRHRPDKVQAAWLKLCRRLAKAGLPRAAHEGARDYAERVAAARPHLAAAMRDLAARYGALRYGAAQEERALQEFISLIAKFPSFPRRRGSSK
jgi:transglutaminase-like putative cysteine protease